MSILWSRENRLEVRMVPTIWRRAMQTLRPHTYTKVAHWSLAVSPESNMSNMQLEVLNVKTYLTILKFCNFLFK